MTETVPRRFFARQATSERCRIAAPTHPNSVEAGVLGRYRDASGRRRDVVARGGAGGSVLVIDRDAATLGDRRLVAHVAADEPAGNAAVACARYLDDRARRLPRRVLAADLLAVPFAPGRAAACAESAGRDGSAYRRELHGPEGVVHRLELVASASMLIPELRWTCRSEREDAACARVVSVRDVVGHREDYEPVCHLTAVAIADHHRDPHVSVAALRAELGRVGSSRIVLNRGLREAVLAVVADRGLSLSEIAVRCGRTKRDARGNVSGETSWLGRRLGLMPEGGEQRPTPWIHSDVLALIARRGLGVSPLEVELG